MTPRFTYSIGSMLFAAAIGAMLLFETGWAWWVCWLIAVNAIVLALYGWDKRRAVVSGFRIPEATLHTLAATGGSPGALVGQRLFRHKTAKREFQLIFWVTAAAQIAVVGWLVAGAPTP